MHSLYSASSGCTACAVSGSAPDRAGHRAVERAARDGHGGVGDRPKPAHARGRDLERSRPAQVTDDVRSAQRARIGIAAPIQAPPPLSPRLPCLPASLACPSPRRRPPPPPLGQRPRRSNERRRLRHREQPAGDAAGRRSRGRPRAVTTYEDGRCAAPEQRARVSVSDGQVDGGARSMSSHLHLLSLPGPRMHLRAHTRPSHAPVRSRTGEKRQYLHGTASSSFFLRLFRSLPPFPLSAGPGARLSRPRA